MMSATRRSLHAPTAATESSHLKNKKTAQMAPNRWKPLFASVVYDPTAGMCALLLCSPLFPILDCCFHLWPRLVCLQAVKVKGDRGGRGGEGGGLRGLLIFSLLV